MRKAHYQKICWCGKRTSSISKYCKKHRYISRNPTNKCSECGMTAYGFWAIQKNGAQVLVGCLEGDPGTRFWMGCFFMPELNRTLPGGIEGLKSEIERLRHGKQ